MHFTILTILTVCTFVTAFPGDVGRLKHGCDAAACEIKCKKAGSPGGYCGKEDPSHDLGGPHLLNRGLPECICIPSTTSCTNTATVTATNTVTNTDTVSSCTNTATVTDTESITATETVTNTDTVSATKTITDTEYVTQTVTQTATTTAQVGACFCCTNQKQLPFRLTGTCDTSPVPSDAADCPIGNAQGRRHLVCCDENGFCTQES
ncbi:hypothetical protein ASPSYDRAFT_90151 [Aspergillus sydowii CBS 593.65]|uniref:Uncharacterized protein n=1 Tax=Aspergillus sydowii CBS 593.65 TaxID=1036612 RepID=A0A1L9TEW5_9EURO|nr:uncharacterized protein ASPSYDRAFT_90151 [Aspergillus sydowii CBS 593.65]OJJ57958.1 hypothetical protein ASPSYDRAFT_90151 [Aspergillus sydowii CBS 593.65]